MLLEHSPRPQMEKDTTSTGWFAQAFLRKAEIPGEAGEESPLGAAAVTSNPPSPTTSTLQEHPRDRRVPLLGRTPPRPQSSAEPQSPASPRLPGNYLSPAHLPSQYLLAAILVSEATRARSSLGVVVPSFARGSAPWAAPFRVEVAE